MRLSCVWHVGDVFIFTTKDNNGTSILTGAIMIIRKLRLHRSWSQEHLAEISGLSTRTIQRIERGQNPSLESLKSLAAVFEIDASELSKAFNVKEELPMEDKQEELQVSSAETEAMEYVKDIKGFYSHLIKYVVVISILALIDIVTSPGKLWFYWPAMGWGIGLFMHGMSVFEIMSFFGPKWEKKQVEKRMRKSR